MSKLVDLVCPVDREELSLRRKELKNIRMEIKETARNPFLTSEVKAKRIRDMQQIAHSVKKESEEKYINITSNYT